MLIQDINRYPYIGYDTEATGLRYPVDRAFGFAIAAPDGRREYWDIRLHPEKIDQLIDVLRHYRGRVICHNASYDYKMTKAAGGDIPLHLLDDTVIRATQINEHERDYSLAALARKYLKEDHKDEEIYQKLADIFGGLATRNVQMPNLQRAPADLVGSYCMQDALVTLRLWEWQEEEIERQGIQKVVEFERRLMPTFIRAEVRGIRVDIDRAAQAMDELEPVIEEKQHELNRTVGREVNVNSSPQIKDLFKPEKKEGVGWVVGDTPIGETKKGGPSLTAEHLREINTPLSNLILEIRSLKKTKDTFLAKHIIGHAVDDRVYPSINQSKTERGGTGTGRLSYQDPAMQQIPSRNKKVAAIVKPCFLPEDGCVWVDADMASFEVRVFAHLINNPQVIQAYKENPEVDFHQFVADITGLVRNAEYSGQPNAKQLNLSMIFNSGDGAIAAKMGMPFTWESFETRDGETVTYRKPGPEAQKVIELYHRRLPGVRELADKCQMKAERRGYIFTYTGRRLRFPGGYKSYKASGLLIQATAADRNKEHWGIIEEVLDGVGFLTLNTHDSYSMSIEEGKHEEYFQKVKRAVEETHSFRVPLILELSGYGSNWWEALQGE